jgi:hypothetical protein
MKKPAHGDSSTGSELKAVEEACREASRTVEPCDLCASAVIPAFPALRLWRGARVVVVKSVCPFWLQLLAS